MLALVEGGPALNEQLDELKVAGVAGAEQGGRAVLLGGVMRGNGGLISTCAASTLAPCSISSLAVPSCPRWDARKSGVSPDSFG